MTVKELSERMDAAELMEWVAYYQLLDKDKHDKLSAAIEAEKGPAHIANQMRMFLSTLKPTKSV